MTSKYDIPTMVSLLPERFTIERTLGSGGFGDVFAVWDEVRRERVAVKTLHSLNARNLMRFKREFRALTNLLHENLVDLYELLHDSELWFFTMELVDGVSLTEHLRLEDPVSSGDIARDPSVPNTGDIAAHMGSVDPSAPVDDHERLRAAFKQLATGVDALHRAGMLHCDLKPSNVLVTRDHHRVVVLDFGLVAEMNASRGIDEQGSKQQFSGTPQYMSPEQAMGELLTTASDWYAVGVMLYQALTGRFPIEGNSSLQILLKKQTTTPTHVLELNPSAPGDLATLAMRLLAISPDERPPRDAILALFGVDAPPSVHDELRPGGARGELFVGREAQLAALERAEGALSQRQQPGFVNVSGESGMGKSTLLDRFTTNARGGDPMILEGRCLENESVPFKALDQIVDDLVSALLLLPRRKIAALLPDHLPALARVFPTMDRLRALSPQLAPSLESGRSAHVRQRAFDAMRELFARVSEHIPLLVVVDDVQWGDTDSAQLIAHIMQEPAPRILFVSAYRTEDVASSPFIEQLHALQHDHASLLTVTVELPQLREEASVELARQLLGGEDIAHDDAMAMVVREAKGSPFFINALARHARHVHPTSPVALSDAMRARVSDLPADARRLLRVVAIAGRPITRELARRVAEIDGSEQATTALLRNEQFIRVTRDDDAEALETYHARVRDALLEHIDADEQVRTHLAIGEVLEADAAAPELLVTHFICARAPERAAHHMLRAAEQAAEALAFERAVQWYRDALDTREWSDLEHRDVLVAIGELVAAQGRGEESVEAYREALTRTPEREREPLRLELAEQLVRSGHFDEGTALYREMLARVGISAPSSDLGMIASIMKAQLRLKLRGLGFTQRSSAELGDEERWRMDLLWSASQHLSAADLKHGWYLGQVHVLDALDAGEPTRLSRALAMVALQRASSERGRASSLELLETAERLAHDSEDVPYAMGFVQFAKGMLAHLASDSPTALDLFVRSERTLIEGCSGVVWEIDGSHFYQYYCHEVAGDARVMAENIPDLRERARARGDQHYAANYGLLMYFVHLAHDDPEAARADIDHALSSWGDGEFLVQHLVYMRARTRTSLYAGDPEDAWQHVTKNWSALKRSTMLGHEGLSHSALDHRAHCALACAVLEHTGARERRTLVREAQRASRTLSKNPLHIAQANHRCIEAELALLDGDEPSAREHMARAMNHFDTSGAHLQVELASMWLTLLEGSSPTPHIERLKTRGIARPERMFRAYISILPPWPADVSKKV